MSPSGQGFQSAVQHRQDQRFYQLSATTLKRVRAGVIRLEEGEGDRVRRAGDDQQLALRRPWLHRAEVRQRRRCADRGPVRKPCADLGLHVGGIEIADDDQRRILGPIGPAIEVENALGRRGLDYLVRADWHSPAGELSVKLGLELRLECPVSG